MVAWATLVVAAIAAVASVATAWRGWHSWDVDRRTDRFNDAVSRALSEDEITARTGRAQLLGMYRRYELHGRDTGWVEDTIAGILGPPPRGDVQVVVDDTDPGDNGGSDPDQNSDPGGMR